MLRGWGRTQESSSSSSTFWRGCPMWEDLEVLQENDIPFFSVSKGPDANCLALPEQERPLKHRPTVRQTRSSKTSRGAGRRGWCSEGIPPPWQAKRGSESRPAAGRPALRRCSLPRLGAPCLRRPRQGLPCAAALRRAGPSPPREPASARRGAGCSLSFSLSPSVRGLHNVRLPRRQRAQGILLPWQAFTCCGRQLLPPWQRRRAPRREKLASPARSTGRWSGPRASTPTRSRPTGTRPSSLLKSKSAFPSADAGTLASRFGLDRVTC